ncbi:MAG: mandelate racemase/muconate lactonizing enzyme family protein, partial [Planctomycetes bacterium]|nr:mandelate racemase/muconate lactonizing enzyme family protein [Planctomycetota bacterium]
PEHVKQLWESMYEATLAFGRKGIAIMAISGVDLALWDLRGKAANKPVAELLGGTVGESIPTYVTVWDDLTEEMAASYKAFKLHVEHREDGGTVDAVAESVRQARKVIGSEPELMIDAWMRWDIETTLNVADATQSMGLSWIEEPLPADDFEGYATLCERSPVPIAGGEHEFTAAGFRELIDRRLHHVLQPDVCWCGGMTELIKIYEMANRAGLRVCPHRGSEVWGLHAMAALDPNPLAESGRPWMTWVNGQPPILDGHIQLSDAPGFGVNFDEQNLQTVW